MAKMMTEFSLIQRYFSRHSSTAELLSVGDDAAMLTPPLGHQLLACTDTLVAGRHFPLNTHPHAIGWKSVAVNLSDIAAMGGTAHSILLALSLPQIDEPWLQHFSDGLYACCEQFGVKLIGGDTTQSPQLSIGISALGFVPQGQGIPRSGAQVGDLIVLSGTVGDAAYALAQLKHQPDSAQQPLRHRLDYPTPRCTLGQQLAGIASSMIDVSDGLAQDLNHILTASKVGAVIELDHLPLSATLQHLPESEKWQYALCGGDDYELCFTISPQHYYALRAQPLPVNIQVIGQIQAQAGLQLLHAGSALDTSVQNLYLNGYQHFA